MANEPASKLPDEAKSDWLPGVIVFAVGTSIVVTVVLLVRHYSS